jgi:cyclic pyranopterin phosphate synthase
MECIQVRIGSRISMADITEKAEILRRATAEGKIYLKSQTIQAIQNDEIKKGDLFSNAELAAINSIKKTSDMIFLAHPIRITEIKVYVEILEEESALQSTVMVQSIAKTGVELEAIMGVMISLLTIFDMCKYLEKDEHGQYGNTHISDINIVEKVKVSANL